MIPDGFKKFQPDSWDRRFNPYLVKWWQAHLEAGWDRNVADLRRWDLIKEYSFAIPTAQALSAISTSSRKGVVEVGAGTGYWAKLLRLFLRTQDKMQLALEPSALAENEYGFRTEHFDQLLPFDHKVLENNSLTDQMTLLLCWPSEMHDWPVRALELFKGDTLAYVGEPRFVERPYYGNRGCTGTIEFHDKLDNEWIEHRRVEIPRWDHLADRLVIYKRKAK